GGSSSRLSQARFEAKANHICSELNRQEQPDLSANEKDAIDRNLGRIDSALGQLRGLRPPADEETRYQELLKSFERTTAFVKANESQLIELTRSCGHRLRTRRTARATGASSGPTCSSCGSQG